jgi:hypothetical protein
VSLDAAVHEPETGDIPPAVSQFCFWFVSVGTLTPVLLVFFVTVVVWVSAAKAVCTLPIAAVLTATIPASAAIATSTVAGL